jgi:hypothetical protein
MKYIFSLLLVCLSYFSFGQMTVSEMMRVCNMDMDQFETYAIAKGYELQNFEKDENVNGMSFAKGVDKQSKWLTFYDNYFGRDSHLNYQTANSSEMLGIKTQLIKLGFKLTESYFDKENLQVKVYRKNKFQLKIITTPPNEKGNFVWYEIGFGKY